MKTNYTYRMYGRSKGRGKNNAITNDAISIKVPGIGAHGPSRSGDGPHL